MKNCIVRYGLLGGTISIGLGLINWFTIAQAYGPRISQAIGYLTLILSLMCVPLGIKYFRDKLNGGTVTFAQGFRIGLGITFIASLINFIYSILFFVFAGDRFYEWRKRGLSEDELREFQARMEQTPDFVFTPLFQGIIFFFTVFLIGLVMNLISTLILRRATIETNSKT